MTAADLILKKALVESGIASKEWSYIQAGLRERAFFSARISEAKILHALRGEVSKVASGDKSASEVRRDIREYLEKVGYAPHPGEEGTIKDLFSRARLDVIIKTNVDQARGWAQHLEATTSGALEAFPAYELVRVEEREQPRNWAAKWAAAGGQFYGSRMIALKTDSIWTRISAFDNPYPPFDFNSGMGVADVSRSECLALGVISEDDEPQTPPALGFNDHLKVEVPFKKNSDDWMYLDAQFGDQMKFDAKTNTIEWRSHLFEEQFEKGNFTIELGESTKALLDKVPDTLKNFFKGQSLTINQDWLNKKRRKDKSTNHRVHFEEMPDEPNDIPLEKGDVDMLPSLWHSPDRVFGSDNDIVLEVDALDGSIFRAVVGRTKDAKPKLKTFYRTKEPYKK